MHFLLQGCRAICGTYVQLQSLLSWCFSYTSTYSLLWHSLYLLIISFRSERGLCPRCSQVVLAKVFNLGYFLTELCALYHVKVYWVDHTFFLAATCHRRHIFSRICKVDHRIVTNKQLKTYSFGGIASGTPSSNSKQQDANAWNVTVSQNNNDVR